MRVIGGILRVACVLLSLSFIYLWGRSTGGQDRIGWTWMGPAGESTTRNLDTGGGSIGLFFHDGGPDPAYAGRDGHYFNYVPASRNGGSVPDGFLGFRFEYHERTNPQGVSERWGRAMMPYALFVILTALPPALWARRWVRTQRRLASDRCRTCGYDLRGLPHLCPECGDRIVPASPTTRPVAATTKD